VDEEEHECWPGEPEVGVADLHERDALDDGVALRDVDGHPADDALQLGAHGEDDDHGHDGDPQHGVPPVDVEQQEDESRRPQRRADPHDHLEVVLQRPLDVLLEIKLAAGGKMDLRAHYLHCIALLYI